MRRKSSTSKPKNNSSTDSQKVAYNPLKLALLYLQNGYPKWPAPKNFSWQSIKKLVYLTHVSYPMPKVCKLPLKWESRKSQFLHHQLNPFPKRISTVPSRKVSKDLCPWLILQRKITSESEDTFRWSWVALTKEKLSLQKFLMLQNNYLTLDVMKFLWEIRLERVLLKKPWSWWKS